jgi:exosortase A-associated hydrolase 1
LLGIVTCPDRAPEVGVVIVVGGPQYRVGSHRQFVLLARALASEGVACFRFDYRGMGDSEGEPVSFETAVPDVRAAIVAFRTWLPGLRHVVLWGLCDGASLGTFAAAGAGVSGLALFNPWVRSEQLKLKSTLRFHYAGRLADRDFWVRLLKGRVRIRAAVAGLVDAVGRSFGQRKAVSRDADDLATRVGRCIAAGGQPTLVVLSANDQTAAEFRLAAAAPGALADALRSRWVERVDVAEADHTFSSERWRDRAAALTVDWLRRHFVDVASV